MTFYGTFPSWSYNKKVLNGVGKTPACVFRAGVSPRGMVPLGLFNLPVYSSTVPILSIVEASIRARELWESSRTPVESVYRSSSVLAEEARVDLETAAQALSQDDSSLVADMLISRNRDPIWVRANELWDAARTPTSFQRAVRQLALEGEIDFEGSCAALQRHNPEGIAALLNLARQRRVENPRSESTSPTFPRNSCAAVASYFWDTFRSVSPPGQPVISRAFSARASIPLDRAEEILRAGTAWEASVLLGEIRSQEPTGFLYPRMLARATFLWNHYHDVLDPDRRTFVRALSSETGISEETATNALLESDSDYTAFLLEVTTTDSPVEFLQDRAEYILSLDYDSAIDLLMRDAGTGPITAGRALRQGAEAVCELMLEGFNRLEQGLRDPNQGPLFVSAQGSDSNESSLESRGALVSPPLPDSFETQAPQAPVLYYLPEGSVARTPEGLEYFINSSGHWEAVALKPSGPHPDHPSMWDHLKE